jgi:hypothetical protein
MQAMKQKYEQDIQIIHDEINKQFNQIISMIQQNPILTDIKSEALIMKTSGA